MKESQRRILRGVVFDMDGTLTVPNLDFDLMYRRCAVDKNKDILAVLAALPEEDAREKYRIIEEMEEEATRTLKIMPGAKEIASWLQTHGIPAALVTRNTHLSAKALEEHIPHFDIILARDNHQDLPPKPDPATMYYIAEQWKVDPASILMVGDSPSNDILFGQTAGAATALVDTGRKHTEAATATGIEADIIVDYLHDLPSQIWMQFHIDSPFGHSQPLAKYDVPMPTSATTKAAFNGRINDMNLKERNEPDKTGNTPLIWAADAGHGHVVAHLLDSGVLVDARGYLGATAACRAARRGHADVLEQLCLAEANLDIPNDKLQCPLHFAAFNENLAAVKVLLKYGANTRVLDRKGRIPAQDTKCKEIRSAILESMM